MTKRNDFKTIGDLYDFGTRKLTNIRQEQVEMLNRWENQTDSQLLQIKDITIYTIELAIRTIDEIIEERNKEAQYQA
jgi:hypothetical protein